MKNTSFEIFLTEQALDDLSKLESPALKKRLKAVNKALAYLQANPHHPSLNIHKYTSIVGTNGEEIFEASLLKLPFSIVNLLETNIKIRLPIHKR